MVTVLARIWSNAKQERKNVQVQVPVHLRYSESAIARRIAPHFPGYCVIRWEVL